MFGIAQGISFAAPLTASSSRLASCQHRRTKILCDPSKPEELAQAILDLYHHPEKCARMRSRRLHALPLGKHSGSPSAKSRKK
jgi:hypothetical protein